MFVRILKKYFVCLVVIASLSLGLAQTPLSPEAQEVLQKGGQAAALALATYDEHFIDKPLWREAVNYGLELQKLAPDNPQTYRFLGQVYSSISFYSRAWEAWERYKRLGGVMNAQTAPYLERVSSWLGSKSFVEENYKDSILYYEALIELEPESEEANQHLALSHIALGQPQEATPYLTNLTQEFPNKADYINLLSRTEEQAKYGTEATEAFYSGIDLYSQGNKESALSAFDKASSLSSTYRKAFVWAGRVSEELAQPAKAINYWKQAVVLNETDEEAIQALELAQGQAEFGIDAYNNFKQGLKYYQQGMRGEAFWSIQRATQFNPNYADAYAWLGQISVENRDLNAALNFYSRAQQLEPSSTLFQSAYSETSRLLTQQVAASLPTPTPTTVAETQPRPQPEATTPPVNAAASVQPPSNPVTPTAEVTPPTPAAIAEPPVSAPTITETPISTPEITEIPKTPTPEPVAEVQPEVPAPVASSPLPTPNVVTPNAPIISASAAQPPTLTATPVPDPNIQAVAVTPKPPKPEPVPVAAGPAVTVLDINYEHQSPDAGGTGAFSFFDSPSSLLSNLKDPVDYVDGKLYQRINVSSKPSGEPVKYQVCLVHNDNLSIGPACSTNSTLQFEEPGVYEVSQALSTFSNFDKIDWTKGIQQVMLILQDKDGNTIDNRVAFTDNSGAVIDLNAYYPMKVKYSAILVPLGGTFPGWP